MKKKVVLAFSGGLDTSFCAKYLSADLGYEVYTAIANNDLNQVYVVLNQYGG